jgi:hypothetical protein
MAIKWREFMSWYCSGCHAENVILEREDDAADQAMTFDRTCTACGKPAEGVTIKPAGIAYRLTSRKEWQIRPS